MVYNSNCLVAHSRGHSRFYSIRTQRISSPLRAALFLAAIAAVLSQPMVACAAITELTSTAQGKGTKGFSWTPLDIEGNPAFFTITARSRVDNTKPFVSDAWGYSGTVYVEKNDKGTGVQNMFYSGSSGISGGGGDKDEELIFTYNTPVLLDSIFLELNDIDFGHGLNDKDDPVLFVSQAGSGLFNTIKENDILSAFTFTADKKGTLDFGALLPLLGYTEVDAFKIRETNDHIYVSGLSGASPVPVPVPVPAPGALVLGCLGTVAVTCMRRQRNLL